MEHDWDEPGHENQREEQGRDSKVDEAREALIQFFEQHPREVFYERQLEVIFEKHFFHWITGKALHELRQEEKLSSAFMTLSGDVGIRLYRTPSHRFWKRQAKEIIGLVRSFSEEHFTRALGQHAELMFDAALPIEGFMPRGRKVKRYRDIEWTLTGHDLDRVIERDGVAYGVEIKNTLPYIPRKELQIKIFMCQAFGIKPLFIVRMAPQSYIEEVRQAGGFTLVFRYQLYPHGFSQFAQQVRDRLAIPVDSPLTIAEGTIRRLLNWHLKNLSP
jgi:hypothetical protein